MSVNLYTVVSRPPPPAPPKKAMAEGLATKPLKPELVEAKGTGDARLQMDQLNATLNATPIIDNELVTGIANAIQAGNYTIDPNRAAEKIIEQELFLP